MSIPANSSVMPPSPSIYQQLLGSEFENLGPILRLVHGSDSLVKARGQVSVVYGKGGIVRLLFIALRPLLLVLGFIKLYEEIESRRRQAATPTEPETDPS